ncbi:MAG: glycoside hydrolase family 3 C-terminal domain-containing protein [Candidatus Tumulicola sp.]
MISALAFCAALAGSSADSRAQKLVASMTQAELLQLVQGHLARPFRDPTPAGAIGSAGFVPGIARLSIPSLQETDAILGIANPGNVRPGDVATAMPSGLALASTWDPQIAYDSAVIVGDEAWHKGFNVLLGPGLDLARDPRNGRNFEYLGEDPLLAGTLAAASICGTQSRHVIATAKHFALNDQETGRNVLSADIGVSAMRESDLLAFEIAIETGQPGAVMCAYNRINGVYACNDEHLLRDVLKRDWRFKGWVMSDWGAVNNPAAVTNGLDQESAVELDANFNGSGYFSAVPVLLLAKMNERILRSMLAVGLFAQPPQESPIDYDAHAQVALREAERGIVLLKNDGTLPIAAATQRVAVIGGHADAGVLSGGGSAQVTPVGGAAAVLLAGNEPSPSGPVVYDPSSPLKAIRAGAPSAQVGFADGSNPSSAAALAKQADVAIVFATRWNSEAVDDPDLTLPNGQDALIEAIAAANPHTIVVLETGNPVTMPWLDRVSGVLECWYPGQKGGEAIANVLSGKVDPSGRLPITFPASEEQLARPTLPGLDELLALSASGKHGTLAPFSVTYSEGGDVGYRRYVKQSLKPLFAFGYGLSYTTFRNSGFRIEKEQPLTVQFDVTNTGDRPGIDTPQVYLTQKAGVPEMRLIGFSSVTLAPGQTQTLTLVADPRLLADFDAAADVWRIRAGQYEVALGSASDNLEMSASTTVAAQILPP